MRTLSLSVVPQQVGCDAECKFCISGSTFVPREDRFVDMCAVKRACLYARNCGALTGIVTGKGEPLLMDHALLRDIIQVLSETFGQVDLHTNGVRLLKNRDGGILETLTDGGLTNLTVSVAHYDSEKNSEVMDLGQPYLAELMKHLKKYRRNLHIRLSCVLAKGYIDTPEEMINYLKFAKQNKIDSVIFRELWVAGKDSPTKKWCQEHYMSISDDDNVWRMFRRRYMNQRQLMELPWSYVYDWNGVSVTASECEYQTVDFAKSLILLPDNHLYYNWSSPASRLW
jgi:molybdenum cofactor biosynthesis enzyme MoaA